jgi:hypothetical protein
LETQGERRGPPPLKPFGLVLHHDARWTHEGTPLKNRKLREAFDRSVRYLPAEGKYVVQLAHFRGEIELEEAGFFVRDFDARSGEIALSDRSREPLEVASLCLSPIDAALLCVVKRDLHPQGLLARFYHAPQAELLHAVEDGPDGPALRVRGELQTLPDLEG